MPGPGRGELLGAVGLAMLLAGFLLIRNDNWAAGSLALVPTLGTLLILGSIQQGDTRLSRWLASPLLVGIGKRSYSLYLWHWPLITLGKSLADLNGKPELYGALAGGLAGVVLACGAYRFIEQPMRQRGPGRSRRLGWTAAMFVAVAAGSLAMADRHPKTDPVHRCDAVLTSGPLYTAGRGPDFEMFSDSLAYCDVAFPPQPARPDDAWRTGGVLHLFGGGKPRVVVLGSSHALMNAHMIDSICKEQGISVAFLCMDSGTPAFFRTTPNYNLATLKEAEEFDQSRRNWLRQWHPSVVLVIDRWDLRTGAGQDFASDLKAFLAEVAPWTDRVLFMSQVPVLQGGDFFNLRELVTWRSGRSGPPPRLMPDQNEPLRQAATAMAEAAMASHPELRVLRADRPFYNPDGSVRYYSARSFFYTNTDHLADAGAEVNRAMVSQAIHAVLEDSDVARAGTGRLQIASASGAGGWH